MSYRLIGVGLLPTLALAIVGLAPTALAQSNTGGRPVSPSTPVQSRTAATNQAASPAPTGAAEQTQLERDSALVQQSADKIKQLAEQIIREANMIENTPDQPGAGPDSIDQQIEKLIVTAQRAMDDAGESGELGDALNRMNVRLEGYKKTIDSMGGTEQEKEDMKNTIQIRIEAAQQSLEALKSAREKTSEAIIALIQARPKVAFWAKIDKVDALLRKIKPLTDEVRNVGRFLNDAANMALRKEEPKLGQ